MAGHSSCSIYELVASAATAIARRVRRCLLSVTRLDVRLFRSANLPLHDHRARRINFTRRRERRPQMGKPGLDQVSDRWRRRDFVSAGYLEVKLTKYR